METGKCAVEKVELTSSSKVAPAFWENKKVFLTGHTGFKGGWLSIWLSQMGANVKGYALEPHTTPSLFDVANINSLVESDIGDIRDINKLQQSIKLFNPDILIHMAAQPLVRKSYIDPVETYETNIMGSINILEAVRSCPNLKSVIIVTSDKCYENQEWVWGYREHDPMGGHDPYSSSKGCVELITASYRNSFFTNTEMANIATARAGNVIGGGDWANDRLVPDILRSFEKNIPVIIRSPNAIRPWQHVLEPLSGYLILAEKLYKEGKSYAEGWNFGPHDKDSRSVLCIVDQIVNLWGDGKRQLDNSSNPHEANILKLDISKAISRLKWQPRWDVNIALKRVVDWHLTWIDGGNMQEECLKQIKEYQQEKSSD